jgi:hypothetical protein
VRREIAPACTRPIAVLPTKFPTDFFWSGYRECSFGDKHKSPITVSLWPFWSPADFPGTSFPAASIAIREPSRRSTGSCATFGYDVELLGRDEVDDTQLIGLTGVVKVSHCQRICHAPAGRFCRCRSLGGTLARQSRRFTGGVMTYSYTQISQYSPADGAIAFATSTGGKRRTLVPRCSSGAFEQALGAYFRREDPGDVLLREWSACKDLQHGAHVQEVVDLVVGRSGSPLHRL